MKKAISVILALILACSASYAQSDRRCVRKGNRDFAKDDWRSAAVAYGTAVAADTTSFAAQYNLASALYRMENWQGAAQALGAIRESVPQPGTRAAERTDTSVEGELCDATADYYYNLGDVAIKSEDWQGAVQAFRQSLLLNPADLDAKENYIYARLKLQNQQNGGGGGSDNQNQDQDQQNQDQNQQNQDQDQQNQDQNQQNQDQDRQDQPQESGISPQQARQMLKAIQEAEKKTQDKVNEEKAALLESRQKDKNW